MPLALLKSLLWQPLLYVVVSPVEVATVIFVAVEDYIIPVVAVTVVTVTAVTVLVVAIPVVPVTVKGDDGDDDD